MRGKIAALETNQFLIEEKIKALSEHLDVEIVLNTQQKELIVVREKQTKG